MRENVSAEFEWDSANECKSQLKHGVSKEEAEEVFRNRPVILPDIQHSQEEDRFQALGVTVQGRVIVIAFTVREGRLRVIMARDAHRKEAGIYLDLNNVNHD